MDSGTLIISPDTLYLFLDEGGEPLAHPSSPAFCIAGCAIHGAAIAGVEQAWKGLKATYYGSADFPFHASSEAVKLASSAAHQAVFDFFKQPFGRFAVGYHGKTAVSDPNTRYQALAGLMQQRGFIDIIRWYPFTRLALIFEECERDGELIESNFGAFRIAENGVAIEPDFYFMPKSSGFACLEMADAVANVAYRQVLRHYRGDRGFGYDFRQVFHSVERKYVYFVSMDKITVNEPADASAG